MAAAVLACTAPAPEVAPRPEYRPDRRSYAAFRAGHPDLLEPNYLPYMLHRIPGDGADGDAVVVCRWEADDMPLAVHIEAPEIPDALQDEFDPVAPQDYVAAADAALALWEAELEGAVRFRRVPTARQAKLRLRLIGDRGPVPDDGVMVLGTTPVARACRVAGPVSERGVLDVAFAVPRIDLYLADEHGLLRAEQVQWTALHEIGHALGMRGHSPIPADLMYEVARDRIQVAGLSVEDVNSFLSLYQIPNGTVFARLPADATSVFEGAAPPPAGEPALALAPFVDPRHGFEIRPPRGWTRIETRRGMAAVDGVSWDYAASLQVIVERYPTIEAYLERYGAHYLAAGEVLTWELGERAGRRNLRASFAAEDSPRRDRLELIESGDGRLFVVLMDCDADAAEAYAPWFEASLRSLEIWPDRRPRRR